MKTIAHAWHLWLSDVRENMRDDRGEVNIVATVLLIVIAVTLVIFFRDAIEGWIKDLVDTISGGVDANNNTNMG
ncbi:hypothetical protein GCM10011331_05950 [Flavimobilis marinus]|uniref:Flagellin N-terminal-like domain-containing protein n=1 Tax=Flavimobilis marinus TaxID=285351 RepID=A0A1I2D4B8_9MICO|nr:Flp1 family type IVb pilin [Flavimobilis marinus]GHG46105.1 hypothetical protein GCM10011331_05950 [Flavimobilis marinus]SFE75378.1 flagellin N-terminal-like domain-containing protein [Flavimobilis marinus]